MWLDLPTTFKKVRNLQALALALTLTIATAGPPTVALADFSQSIAVGVSSCDNAATSQLCTPVPTLALPTAGVLRVQFVAATTHCSDIIAHLLIDGTERYSARLGPGGATGIQDFGPVTAGVHRVGVQAEGVLGGCNAGTLASWAGTLAITVSGVTAAAVGVAAPGDTVSVSTLVAGSPAPAGLSASYVRPSTVTGLATLAAATYDHNPVLQPQPPPIMPLGFVDLLFLGGVSTDVVQARFVPPDPIIPPSGLLPNPPPITPPSPIRLAYLNGTAWSPVLSSGNALPSFDTATSTFSVTFSASSTPQVSVLSGTVFATIPSYGFVGFLAPVDNAATNVARAGRAIPLKWSVYDLANNPVTTLSPSVVQVSSVTLGCASLSTATDSVAEYAAGGSGLQNLGGGAYQLNWDTSTVYAGSCRQLRLDLGERNPDGTPFYRTANFQFSK